MTVGAAGGGPGVIGPSDGGTGAGDSPGTGGNPDGNAGGASAGGNGSASEVCDDGVDNDDDGLADCADPDCASARNCRPSEEHNCNDGIDNDHDGLTDCQEEVCAWACAITSSSCGSGQVLLGYSASDLPQDISTAKDVMLDSIISIDRQGSVAWLALRFSAQHSWDGDVILSLNSPMGTERMVVQRRGDGGQNFLDTVFVDSADASIKNVTQYDAPFNNKNYQPEDAFSAFAGERITGNWRAHLVDPGEGDGGIWTQFSLALCVTPASAAQ